MAKIPLETAQAEVDKWLDFKKFYAEAMRKQSTYA